MLSPDWIMGAKEAAAYLDVSVQALSNLRKRNEDFPKPFKELNATPIFDKRDIERWAMKHNRNFKPVIATINGERKIIALCGSARVGKSFIVSLFSDDPFTYRTACSRDGADFTQCAVQNYVSMEVNEPYAVFHNKRKDDHGTDKDEMDGTTCPVETGEFSQFIDDIFYDLKKERAAGKDISDACIKVYLRPSQMAREIMEKCNVKTLIITDTPGVSGNYDLVPIEKADLVILVAANINGSAAKESYEELVKDLMPLVTSSRMCFMYNIRGGCNNETHFQTIQDKAKDAMRQFEDYFKGLSTSIINSSMEILQPAKTVIGIPNMMEDEMSVAEDLFVKHITKKLAEFLTEENISVAEVEEEIREAEVTNDELTCFAKELFKNWTFEALNKDAKGEYTIESFKNEKHNRVMTGDNFRIHGAIRTARWKQLQNLYNEFKEYKKDDHKESWKQKLIKYVYCRLSSAVKEEMGVFRGTHTFEADPSDTMYAIESILAKEVEVILSDPANPGSYKKINKFIALLESYGVTSNSWGYVSLNMQNQPARKKLQLITKCKLDQLKAENLVQMVQNRYILGMQKLAEYNVWRDLLKIEGVSEEYMEQEIEKNM